MRRCSAPACHCVSPCDAHYSNQDEYEERECPGWRDCDGCESCEDTSLRYYFRRARRAHTGIGGKPIPVGAVYALIETVQYRKGGPFVQRTRRKFAISPTGLVRWEAAGSPLGERNSRDFYAAYNSCW